MLRNYMHVCMQIQKSSLAFASQQPWHGFPGHVPTRRHSHLECYAPSILGWYVKWWSLIAWKSLREVSGKLEMHCII